MLVPILGILGAAVSTLISYILLVLVAVFMSRKFFPIGMPWAAFFKFGAISLAMYLLVSNISFASQVVTIAARMATGVTFYVRQDIAGSVFRYRAQAAEKLSAIISGHGTASGIKKMRNNV